MRTVKEGTEYPGLSGVPRQDVQAAREKFNGTVRAQAVVVRNRSGKHPPRREDRIS